MIERTLIESGNDICFLGKWSWKFFMEFMEFCFVFVYISKFQSAETETLRQGWDKGLVSKLNRPSAE